MCSMLLCQHIQSVRAEHVHSHWLLHSAGMTQSLHSSDNNLKIKSPTCTTFSRIRKPALLHRTAAQPMTSLMTFWQMRQRLESMFGSYFRAIDDAIARRMPTIGMWSLPRVTSAAQRSTETHARSPLSRFDVAALSAFGALIRLLQM